MPRSSNSSSSRSSRSPRSPLYYKSVPSKSPAYIPPSNKPAYIPPSSPSKEVVKQETPSLVSSMQQGFGFGMGSSLAHRIFDNHSKLEPEPITKQASTTIESYTQTSCNEIQNQFIQCDFDGSCSHQVKYDFKQCQLKGFLN
jgi:hypothetical protein